MGWGRSSGWGKRLARAVGAFVVADLITGLAAFSMISFAGLWIFSFNWIRLSALDAPIGVSLGAAWQLDLAWAGEMVCLPMIGVVAYLAYTAYGVPRAIWPSARRPDRSPWAFLAAVGGSRSALRRHR